ncbi:MAG: 2-aminoethylphosphonate--pyruvate transaminase [Desulfohalobiaceae bacterium]|nr:2-aminoethylphosphonate--pyruvate transaminase [Desulfohalobiaceae bacterium]
MDINMLPDNPYLLLTPGPLSTTKSVKSVMLRDWCTWDEDYKSIVRELRERVLKLATADTQAYTSVLMQGSGTFSVEAVIGSMIPENGKLLVLANGSYGQRIAQIARYLHIQTLVNDSGEQAPPDLKKLEQTLQEDPEISHVSLVHCETTTGMLNPIKEVGRIVKQYNKTYFVDTMSSLGGIPFDIAEDDIDFVVTSSNKCIQGVPGFGIIIARRAELEKCKGRARSLSLDLYDQWKTMDIDDPGKWRYTSPTHTVRAFYQALMELEEEGGVAKRYERYSTNQRTLVQGMRELGFQTLLPDAYQSPIITSFLNPESEGYSFMDFYDRLKAKGFVIYPGKVTSAESFRIGNIGHVYPEDIKRLLEAVKVSMYWKS